MDTPYGFLRIIAKIIMNALGLGFAGEVVGEVLPDVARDLMTYFGGPPRGNFNPDATADSIPRLLTQPVHNQSQMEIRLAPPKFASQPSEGMVVKELEALAQSPPKAFRDMVKKIVKEEAGDQSEAIRRAVADYLMQVPSSVRKALKSAGDPTGTTAPPGFEINSAEKLATFLPARIPPLNAIRLTVIEGVHLGKAFTLTGHDTFLVGRSKRAHFRLPKKDRYFSRVHFMIEANPPQCKLTDMGSRNGTFVNNQPVEEVELKDGDQVKAGRTVFRVRVYRGPTEKPLAVPIAKKSANAENVPVATVQSSVSPRDLPPPPPLTVSLPTQFPLQIPGYEILKELGQGGMGVVYLARCKADGSLVALKTIKPVLAANRRQLDRFLREVRILEQLDHPNIVPFREVGEVEGTLFFAMDYVDGHDAARLLRDNNGSIPISRAVNLIAQMLQALEYAHAKGFVHRDIKPGNLLVKKEDKKEIAYLADFGLARVYESSPLSGLSLSGLTQRGEIGGTIAYMAPEQITNFRECKPQADQYSAAATLYHLLTGRLIYDLPRHAKQQLVMILNDPPIPLRERKPDFPEELATIIHRALSREPAERFKDVRELRRALRPFYV